MEFPRRVFDGEGVKADVDFGPTLMLNRNRCILCTRCVRFMREIDGDAQISIVDRGYGSEIATFQEAGRALAALRQPDGRLPGRRDHDARLPVQVAALGQPGGRRHDLHALREGLQHDRVDQSQAGMGEGRAAGPHDAAVQPRRQRLLDVRHRPLRLSLDRRRRAAAAAAAARRQPERSKPADWRDALSKPADRVDGGRRHRPRCDSSCPRTPRSRSCSSLAGSAGAFGTARRRRGDQLARTARNRSRRHAKFKIPPVDAPNVERRARPGLPGAAPASIGEADLSAFRAAGRSRDACRRCMSSIPDPTDRSAMSRGSSTARERRASSRCSSCRASS